MPNTSANGLISSAYRAEQEKLHQSGVYGTVSVQYAPMVSQIIERMGVTHLLDYGCGSQRNLAKNLKIPHKITYQAYDPGVPEFSTPPVPAQMVACIDVLEHIEPDCLEAVLDDLKRVTEGILFTTVCSLPAFKTLSDGRNAHLIQEPMSWWLPKFWERFELQTVQATYDGGFVVVALAKNQLEAADGSKL
jgi:hypothetical protein